MMYIDVAAYSGSASMEAKWWSGQPLPKLEPESIISIQADGTEKQLIERIMPSMVVNRHVGHWYGDLARAIYLNLKSSK